MLRILSPAGGATVKEGPVTITIALRSKAELRGLRVTINGRLVEPLPSTSGERGGGVVIPAEGPPLSSEERAHVLRVPLPPGESLVSIVAEAGGALTRPSRIRLRGAPAETRPADLFLLAVGIGQAYDERIGRLLFPEEDALSIAHEFKQQKGRLYRTVVPSYLTEQTATRDNILNGLGTLSRRVTERDTMVFFLAGHGVLLDGEYYFVPFGGNLGQRETLVSGREIKAALRAVRGTVIVFLDTCHAAGATRRRAPSLPDRDVSGLVEGLKQAAGDRVIYTASRGDQSSFENKDWGHGAFTLAILEGLRGRAARRGRVTATDLEVYLNDRVPELTRGEQTPATEKYGVIEAPIDFPLALMASPPAKQPVWKKWWFWTLIGAGAAGLAAGLAGGLAPRGPLCPARVPEGGGSCGEFVF